jgi:uncharacterized protein (DUF2062 family)
VALPSLLSPRALLERIRGLVGLDGPPWRTALALAVGVFISCTPLWGFHTILSLLVATLFRLHKGATVTGAWLNLPWLAPFVYGGALKIGGLILPGAEGLTGLSLALLIGTTIVGAVAGALTYVVALGVLSWRRARRDDLARSAARRSAG